VAIFYVIMILILLSCAGLRIQSTLLNLIGIKNKKNELNLWFTGY
jgi:hypothetical protein